MIMNRLARSRALSMSKGVMAAQQTRSFGGGHGDPNHVYKYVEIGDHTGSKTKIKVPSQHDIDYQLPKKGTRNEWFFMWLHGRWDPT